MKMVFRLEVLLICLITISSTLASCDLADPDEPIAIKNTFVIAFNGGNLEAFRSKFNPVMKKRNPASKLKGNFENTRGIIGGIQEMTLDKKSNKVYEYHSRHKIASLSVVFTLDDFGQLTEMVITNYDHKDAPKLDRNVSELTLPFNGEWYVFWGGESTSDNYHNSHKSMRGAYDFWVMGTDGKSHKDGAQRNEDFYAYGKEIIAPTGGEILYVNDGIEDNKWRPQQVIEGLEM
ncbi:MAG: hypothetical protein RJQ09_08430 [Cyclobacteriaceae bacterium]